MEEIRPYEGKEYYSLMVQDQTPGHPMLNPFEYAPTESERAALKGKAQGKVYTFGLRDTMGLFNGRPRFTGCVIQAEK
jgi:YHS domain-containing protein